MFAFKHEIHWLNTDMSTIFIKQLLLLICMFTTKIVCILDIHFLHLFFATYTFFLQNLNTKSVTKKKIRNRHVRDYTIFKSVIYWPNDCNLTMKVSKNI
jgi:hypothetical protein